MLHLEIDSVILRAEQICDQVQSELTTHPGIIRVAAGVVGAAYEAKRVASHLRRPWGAHRIPVVFLALALAFLGGWIYWHFFHVATLTVAVPERDASELRQRLLQDVRVRFREVMTNGSRENIELLQNGAVDLAFVQGGMAIPSQFPRLKGQRVEYVIYFVRDGLPHPQGIDTVITSVKEQGSHTVAQAFARAWGVQERIRFVHDWPRLTTDQHYTIPDEVDAVLVTKDPGDDKIYRAIERLIAAGFRFVSPDIGGHAVGLPFLQPVQLPAAYLSLDPPVPTEPTATYAVATYLVARDGLTPRLLAGARPLVTESHWDIGYKPSLEGAGAVLQGVEAFLGIIVYIGLAFLALLGLEVATYRRRFHELNTLISLISMHQSNKDILGLEPGKLRQENLRYLELCSDLLGLISVISGYYAQENASLIYSNMLEIIHHRSNGLKLNIQIKILHAGLVLPDLVEPA